MRSGLTSALILLVCGSVLLGAVAPAAAGSTVQASDPFEPNDDFGTAAAIEEGNSSAEIVDGESDFYRIEANTTDALDLEVNPNSGPVVLRLYDSDRNELASKNNRFSRTNSLRITRKIPKDGVYYVEIAGKNDGTTTNYTLDYDKVTPAENDPFAPNGEFEIASTLPEGPNDAKVWGGESDFYRIEANTTDALDLEVNPNSGPVVLRLYDSDRNELASKNNRFSRTNPLRITRKVPEDGVYYVEVAGKNDGTTTDYTLDYDKVTPAENDPFAPNGEFEIASTLPEGPNDAKVWGGESDFYRVEANTTDALDLEVNPNSGPVVLRLYDSDRNELASKNNRFSRTNPLRITRKVPEDGVYYVEIAGKNDGTTTNYTLDYDKVTPAENDDFAPNGEFEVASDVPEGFNDAKVWGGESDFYRVEANTTDALDLEVNPNSGPVVLRLYDSDRNELASKRNRFSRTNPLRITQKVPGDGVYYVEVAGKNDGTTTDYTLNYKKIIPAENDPFAPNDGFGSAATITEQFTDATVWGGESDFYRIGLNASEGLRVEVDPDSGPVILRVYDPDRNELASKRNRFARTGAKSVAIRASRTGNYYVEVAGKNDGTTTDYTLESNRTGAFADTGPPPVVGDRAPTDPDDDGLYEDLDGDGSFDIFDVQTFLDRFGSAPVQNTPSAFNFDGSGGVDIFDVQALLDEV